MGKMYQDALKIAVDKLKKIHPEELVRKSGIKWDKDKQIFSIPYFNKTCSIKYPEIKFINEEELNDKEKILILHYLIGSSAEFQKSKIKEETKLISFKEIETGEIYFPSIETRVYKPIIEKFGNEPEEFLTKSIKIGGEISDFSKFSVKFQIFPEVSTVFVLYPSDEEFPSSCQVLFNSEIREIFEIEDIVIMCEEIVEKLM